MRKIFSLRAVLFFSLIVLMMTMAMATPSSAQIRISVGFAPPALPVYDQPICPGDGYLWTPGYWAWDPDNADYYWVPGAWVEAPEVGYLWTPPWWGWADGAWVFNEGWWGPTVGFYGGISYGFGYFGVGFVGGRWDGGHFFYNRAVWNINTVSIHNVYEERVNVNVNHVSFNGGPGGIEAHPRPQDEAAARERHIGPVAAQTQHINAARGNPEFRASANHGRPPDTKEAGGAYHPPANREGGAASAAHVNHPSELPPIERTTPNTGNAKRDQKYQQQQDKLIAKQNQDRQKLQAKQDKEHQQLAKQNADEARKQQTEQRHQQQTQHMQEQHTQQRQQLQQHYAPPPSAHPPK